MNMLLVAFVMPQHQSTTKAWRPNNTDNGPGRGWTMFASLMYCNS